jgi:hypothetical protein
MGLGADIIRLEVEIIKRAMMTKQDVIENEVHRNSGLTTEQWIAHYAPRFRKEVEAILKKTGKLPTAEQVERVLYHN